MPYVSPFSRSRSLRAACAVFFSFFPGSGHAQAPVAVPAVPAQTISTRPFSDADGPRLADSPDSGYQELARELAMFSRDARLPFGSTSDEAINRLQFVSADPAKKATYSKVPVTGQLFGRALRVDSPKTAQEWMTHLQWKNTGQIKKGDVIYITFWARNLVGGDFGKVHFYYDKGTRRTASFPDTWERQHLNFAAARNFQPGEMNMLITFGEKRQIVDFASLAIVNLGPGIEPAGLPHKPLILTYPGREPNAPWRAEAAKRIEKYRKADLDVQVVGADGKPVKGASVSANMTRHDFLFGASLPLGMLPGTRVKPINEDFKRTAGAPQADKERLQKEFLRLFNTTLAPSVWGTWAGGDGRISQADILAGAKWFADNNIVQENAQTVYPSPEFTAKEARKLLTKETAGQFTAALRDWIKEAATTFKPYAASFQIANELEGRPQYTAVQGTGAVPDWFKWTRDAAPDKLIMINGAYSLGAGPTIETQSRGENFPTSDGLQYYFDLISWLNKQGAPLDYIGFQNHTGLGAPGPEAVLQTMSKFALALNKPLEVTEFEITLQDGKSAEQRKYQADYLRDYFTAVFSHPSARGIILQDFWQPGAWQHEGASCFFNKDWSLNPHGREYEKLVLNDWWTRAKGTTGSKGAYQTRGFLGDYEITVTAPDGRTKTVKAQLPKTGATVKIVLQ